MHVSGGTEGCQVGEVSHEVLQSPVDKQTLVVNMKLFSEIYSHKLIKAYIFYDSEKGHSGHLTLCSYAKVSYAKRDGREDEVFGSTFSHKSKISTAAVTAIALPLPETKQFHLRPPGRTTELQT